MKTIQLFIVSLLFASCVGTVDDKNLDTTKTVISSEKKLDFNGIVGAEAISDSRVAVFFNATPGNPADYSYEIVVNNSQDPINVRGDSLEFNASGQYTYIVTGLAPASKYAFNINVNGADGTRGEGSLNIYATTFSNKTCEFEGVSSVSIPAGVGGKTSLIVKWVPAVTRSTSVVFKNIQDPYKYLIYRIEATSGANNLFNDAYNAPDKKVVEINASAVTEYRFTGLDSGKKYFFGVRCLHDGYKSNNALLVEKNLKTYTQTTRDNTAIFDWQPAAVNIITPSGKIGEKQRVFTWDSASGDFFNYRLYYKGYSTDPTLVADPFTEVSLTDPEIETYKTINPEEVSYELNLSDADKYKFYHMKLVACATAQCLTGQRIGLDSPYLITQQIFPKIAPFQGIQKIDSPRSATAVDSIWVQAEAPSMSEGHAHKLNIYCLKTGSDKTTRFVMNPDGTFGTGVDDRGSCADLTVAGTVPTTEPELYAFSELEIKGAKTDGTEYCLMMTPVLENISPAYYYEDIASAAVKCANPEIKTPKLYEFAGKDSCSLVGTSSSKLSINWSEPTEGIYSGYYVYYKDEEVGSAFSFVEAIQAQKDVDISVYNTPIDIPNRTTYTNDLVGLSPGHSYEIGVLTYVVVNGVTLYSENNLKTSKCTVPIPQYDFQEWTEVMALGPKTNELYPKDRNAYFVQESLDAWGRPFEVVMKEVGVPADFGEEAADSAPTFGLDDEYVKGDLYGNINGFNGAYGSTTNSTSMTTPLRYSNTGVIKFSFRDVLINIDGSNVPLSDYATNTIGLPPLKKDRKYGYKVLRSEDNGTTWEEITKSNFGYQSISNNGLIIGASVSKTRANSGESIPAGTEWIVDFTDYSVSAESMSVDYIERARIYQYKVVPIFDDQELEMSAVTNNSTHNIIKITLPPQNMALVHRWMANRSWCREMGRLANTAQGLNYSCTYNGLGAQGVSLPWRVGLTVVDLGGDLLVDRYELGCNFTRGDSNQDASNNTSVFSGSQINFEGLNSLSSPSDFKGCYYNESSPATENNLASQFSRESGGSTGSRYSEMVRGDCIGDGTFLTMARSHCPNPARFINKNVNFPGETMAPGDCSTDSLVGDGLSTAFNYEENSVQSLFGSVFYQRHKYTSKWQDAKPEYKAPGAAKITLPHGSFMNNCMINLPYVNSSGKYRPRWVGTSSMLHGLTNTLLNTHKFYDQKISDVLSNSELYDLTDVIAPTLASGVDPNMPISRIFASNGSNLPPLDGANQTTTHNLCSTFDVEVGIKVGADNYAPFGEKKSKRLLRRKEYIAASAWHESYADRNSIFSHTDPANDGTILQIEAAECNSGYKGVNAAATGGDVNEIGEKIESNFGFFGNATNNVPILTGSGISNGTEHSAKCVSKYGVQDLVGNVEENVSDQLFCFTGEQVMFNKSSPSLSSSDPEWSPYPYMYIEETEFDSLFKTPFVDTTNTGRCSINEVGASRSYDPLIPGSSIINSIFNEIGGTTINPLVVPKEKLFDIESLNQARNGDGSFLDFGNNRIGPNLSTLNNLETGTYFSNILGLPLQCSGTACDDSEDNKVINNDPTFSTAARVLTTLNNVSFADGQMYKFGLGNSEFKNVGTLETYTHTDFYDPSTMPESYSFSYIKTLTYGAGIWTSVVEDAKDNGGIVNVKRLEFKINRSGAVLSMPSGGSVYKQKSGRYTTEIKNIGSYPRPELNTGMAGRCTILINEE